MSKAPKLLVTKDSSKQYHPRRGFKIYLNKRLSKGTIITNDVQFGSYLVVTGDKIVREGNSIYNTTVKVYWEDDECYIPSHLLKGTNFYIVIRGEKRFSFINWFKKKFLHKYI